MFLQVMEKKEAQTDRVFSTYSGFLCGEPWECFHKTFPQPHLITGIATISDRTWPSVMYAE